jgi:hypothetical protein
MRVLSPGLSATGSRSDEIPRVGAEGGIICRVELYHHKNILCQYLLCIYLFLLPVQQYACTAHVHLRHTQYSKCQKICLHISCSCVSETNKLVQAVSLLSSAREDPSSNLGRDSEYPDVFHGFPQAFHDNVGIVLQIRPRLFTAAAFPIHYDTTTQAWNEIDGWGSIPSTVIYISLQSGSGTQTTYLMSTDGCSPGVKRPGREVNDSPSFRPRLRMGPIRVVA